MFRLGEEATKFPVAPDELLRWLDVGISTGEETVVEFKLVRLAGRDIVGVSVGDEESALVGEPPFDIADIVGEFRIERFDGIT